MTGIVIRPVRFTDDVMAMRAFLEVIGLRPRIASDSGTWVDMSAGEGLVALHEAAGSDSGGVHGATRLSFESDDLDALGARLKAAGVADIVIYDETYGRVLTCTDPLGDRIMVDERMDDLYGYRRLGTDSATAPMAVLPVRFTAPAGDYGAFLEAFGLTRVDEPNDYFVRYTTARDGSVGLHYVYSDALPIVAGPAAAHLTFASAEPMPEIAERLRSAGFEPTVTVEDFGSMLSVTDPDGQEVQVHEPAKTSS